MPVCLSPGISLIDTFQFGEPRINSVYTVTGTRCALIDTGTPHAATRLREALGSATPEVILLTHIHLDHAGGAPGIVEAFPQTTVYVHESGVRHLTDPTRLNASVRSATGPLADLYGAMAPLPSERIESLHDGDEIELGRGRFIQVIATPGHAPHHLCFFERSGRALFCGDAVGVWRFGEHIPATVPPSFDLKASLRDLDRLRVLQPKTLCFPHFGQADRAAEVLDRYETILQDWVEAIREHRQGGRCGAPRSDEQVVDAVLDQPRFKGLSEPLRWEAAMFVRGVLLYLDRDIG